MNKDTENTIDKIMKEMNESIAKAFAEQTVEDMVAKVDERIMEELEEGHTIFIDKINREGNLDEKLDKTLLAHELIHQIGFAESRIFSKQQSERKELSYSADVETYEQQFAEFMNYVARIKEIEDFAFIRVQREENSIRYGRLKQGFPVDNHEIAMTDEKNLRELYESLKIVFAEEFSEGSKHEEFKGWSLLPSIGDTIMLEIESDNQDDKNWIYDEIHNKPRIIDAPKKR